MSGWNHEISDDEKIDAAESWIELRNRNAKLIAAIEDAIETLEAIALDDPLYERLIKALQQNRSETGG